MLQILPWSLEFFSSQCLYLRVALDGNLLPPVVSNQLLTWCILNKPSAAGLMQVCVCTCTQVSESQTNYPPWEQDVNGFSREIFLWHFHIFWVCQSDLWCLSSRPPSDKQSLGGGGGFEVIFDSLEQKVLNLRHVLTPNWDVGFAPSLKICMKTSGSTKSGVTPFVASALRTRVFLTPLPPHVGRVYVLRPRIDMNCRLRAEMIPARPAVGQIYTDAHITGKALAACQWVKLARPEWGKT